MSFQHLVGALALLFSGAANAAELTLERLVADPPLQGRVPRQAEISPGGGFVSFLRPSAEDSEQLELWAQPSSGGAPKKLASAAELLGGRQATLTEAEKMALERKRIYQRGITSYRWCGDGDQALLFPLSGDLYLLRLGQPAQRLTMDPDVPEQDPLCSPDGTQVAYVKNGNLWVQPLSGGTSLALTTDATEAQFYGLAEFIAAEEFDRQRGFWWSPDGRRLLVLRVDEAGVSLKTRAQIFADRTSLTTQRYPAAGEANAQVTAFVIDLASTVRTPLPLPTEAEYIARAGFFADGTPWLQWLARDQKHLALTEFALPAAAPRRLIDERDDAWVEVHDDLAELPGVMRSGHPALLWSSEASGRRQLYLIDRQSGARSALTAQAEAVAQVVCAAGQHVVFSGAAERGRARELFVVNSTGQTRPLAGAAPQQWRDARGDRACQQLLVTRSAWAQPPTLALRSVEGKTAEIALPGDAPAPLLAQIAPVPQALDLISADGSTRLNGFYFAPVSFQPGRQTSQQPNQQPNQQPKQQPGPHPVITLAYGGPGAATVAYRWERDTALIAYWQRRGYGVFMIDTRGMAFRDRAFTRAHQAAFGQVEVADLFAAVRQLPGLVSGVDATRIGFFGWSYGGYLAARAMLDTATPFAAAVGVAPVTDWTLYDTAYTERYLGMPDGGKAVNYARSNLSLRAALLTKPLMLVHGTADDNVLFEHSLRLIEALQNEGRVFDTLIYPGKAHGISGRVARLHLDRSLDAFFDRHLIKQP